MEKLLTVIGSVNLLAILAIFWKGGERIGTIETDIDWLKKGLGEIKETVKNIASNQSVGKDNTTFNLMSNASPLRLQPEGLKVLENSGMKSYVDSNKEMLHKHHGHDCDITAYEIQEKVFDLFDNIEFDKKNRYAI